MSTAPRHAPEGEIAQAVRRAHCARKGSEHQCVGECRITPAGVALSCRLCGSDVELIQSYPSDDQRLARSVVEATGMTWEALAPERQVAAIEAAIYWRRCTEEPSRRPAIIATVRHPSIAERCRSLAKEIRRAGFVFPADDLEEVARELEVLLAEQLPADHGGYVCPACALRRSPPGSTPPPPASSA